MLRHYYTVALARFKHTCQQGELVEKGEEPSLEDCIMGLKGAVSDGSSLKVRINVLFYFKFNVIYDTCSQGFIQGNCGFQHPFLIKGRDLLKSIN